MALTFDRTLENGIRLAGAYAWIREINLDLRTFRGNILLDVHPSEADWEKPPVEQIRVEFGQPFPGGTSFPTLGEALLEPGLAAAYQTLGEAIYFLLVNTHPLFRTPGGR